MKLEIFKQYKNCKKNCVDELIIDEIFERTLIYSNIKYETFFVYDKEKILNDYINYFDFEKNVWDLEIESDNNFIFEFKNEKLKHIYEDKFYEFSVNYRKTNNPNEVYYNKVNSQFLLKYFNLHRSEFEIDKFFKTDSFKIIFLSKENLRKYIIKLLKIKNLKRKYFIENILSEETLKNTQNKKRDIFNNLLKNYCKDNKMIFTSKDLENKDTEILFDIVNKETKKVLKNIKNNKKEIIIFSENY